ncbi:MULTISPECIES: helix-turn-helix domain-containing protein [Photorhabdus]|uniref:Helix-turn-helix domain-containing protein n=2 Tax=Photorhabdus TaxID=29487 RepID=A0A329X7A2_9GAMM|nr:MULTISPECIES: helix-turn-helix transcriptional regulator [Photorhabdus]MCC8376120.1 helix-turn-helix transcriptional regulator [Photorhabdus bodei]MCC8465282.1 helix-turn-helix transcriptional regulator [Photorhabdus bodei]MCT8353225.1 helix-turn-helix domain-containing protein [Photorhabdus kayaii]MDB6369596.1 helix-turn-helix transcriptional regulator [Photorhabdus bodei]MDB6371916.1 helix-turn-helix transcriptional regulator [Photorhabdus bodei]
MSDNDYDIIPFSEAKTLLLEDAATLEAYNDIQIRKALMKQLKDARKALHLTQQDVAQKIGTQKQNISRMENGKSVPNLDTLSRYAAALGGRFVFQMPVNQ